MEYNNFNPLNFFLIKDIAINILLKLDYDDILKFCITSKTLSRKFIDDNFWMLKAKEDFNVPFNEFKVTFFEPKIRYLQLMTYYNDIGRGAEMFVDARKYIKLSIMKNKNYLLKHVNLQIYLITKYICMLEFYVKKDDIANAENCFNGLMSFNMENQHLVRSLKCKKFKIKSLDMLNLFNKYTNNKYTDVLKQEYKIFKYGNFNLIKYLYKECNVNINPDLVMVEILKRGDIEIFNFTVNRLPNIDIKPIIPVIYTTKNWNFINYVLKYYNVNIDEVDFTKVLCFSSGSKNLDFFTSVMKKKNINFEVLFDYLTYYSSVEIIDFVLTMYKPTEKELINFFINSVHRNDSVETLEYFIKHYKYLIAKILTLNRYFISILRTNVLVKILNILKDNNIILNLNLYYPFINAIRLKDKYFISVIYNYNRNITWDVKSLIIYAENDNMIIDYLCSL